MKIVCPSCHAQYEVPEVVLTSRRKMRCARCGGEWVPADLEQPEPPPPPPAEETVATAEEPASVETLDEPTPPEPPAEVEDAEPPAPAPVLPDEPVQEHEPPTMAAPVEVAAIAEPLPDIMPEPQPLKARRAEPRVGSSPRLPNPISIVVPPAAKGPPVLAWVASVALVVALAAAVIIYRVPIMKAWPPSARLLRG